MNSNFVHLRNHTAYSLLEGAITCSDIVNMCIKFNMPACAITDTNNLFGGPEFTENCINSGVQPIIGTQLNIDFGYKNHKQQSIFHQLVLLVQNEVGYKNLLKILSIAHLEHEEIDAPNISFDKLSLYNDGIIILTGNNGNNGILSYLIGKNDINTALDIAEQLKSVFGKDDRFFIELQRHGLNSEITCEEHLLKIAKELNLPLVATNECYFKNRDNYYAARTLWCIANGTYLTSENNRVETSEHYFKSPEEMIKLFSDIPSAIENTINIAKRCNYMIPKREPLLPSISKNIDEKQTLIDYAYNGLQQRFQEKNIQIDKQEEYIKQLDYELSVINKMNFNGYFLIVSDFINWAKQNNIPVGPGRGSGAGSMVAWALRITDLDPFRWGLLFERFLNPERVSMPDFDIDFCQDRRSEVIEYVQNKYGFDSVGQIITFGTLQAKAVIRDVGRVMQIPYNDVDKIAKTIPFKMPDDKPKKQKVLEYLKEKNILFQTVYKAKEEYVELIDTAIELEGLFRHASTHAAGVVIGDRPLVELIPLYKDPKSKIPLVEFDMHWVENSGLIKYDFLGLTTLSIIKQTLDKIEKNHGIKININNIPYTDQKAFNIFTTTRTRGVFQFESAGMRGVCKKIKPDCIEDLIAIVSLYRPGPMDQIPKYINRKLGLETVEYLHPLMENILKETYGIMVYQEQVMQIAQKLAGYTLGKADELRRAMGKKIQAKMDEHRVIFVKGCFEKNNIDENTANTIFDQMAAFAKYGFNKSHAACYAWIAYQTAYLKAYYPLEFLTSSMNYAIGDPEKILEFKEEAKSFNIDLLQPDINKSVVKFETNISETGKQTILYGLLALKNAGEQALKDIISERDSNGEFKSILDFANRINTKNLNKRTLESLILSGTFDSLEKNRRKLIENIELILSTAIAKTKDMQSNQVSLFEQEERDSILNIKLKEISDFTRQEKLEQEKLIIGFYISDHPLDTKKHIIRKLFTTPLKDVANLPDGTRTKIIGIVTEYSERIAKSSGNLIGILKLIDKEYSIEVMFAGKNLTNLTQEKRELLRIPGKIVLLTLDTKKIKRNNTDSDSTGDDIRNMLFAQDIELLNEKSTNEFKDIKIKIFSQNAINDLINNLKKLNSGKSRITLIINKNNDSEFLDEKDIDKEEKSDEIKVILPDTYTISEKTLTDVIAKINDLDIVF